MASQKRLLALRASAGSGKTFNLALRFIYLLFRGAKAHQILTITFTKKASNEMRHRIYDYLHTLMLSIKKGTYEANTLYQNLRERGLTHNDIASQIDDVYRAFMQNNPRIMTIDAFFHSVLKKFCWYVGVSTSFEVGKIAEDKIHIAFFERLNANQIDKFVAFCYQHHIKIRTFLSLLTTLCEQPKKDIESAFSHKLNIDFHNLQLKDIEAAVKERMVSINEYIQSVENGHQTLKKGFYKDSIQEIIGNDYLFKWSEHSYFKKYDLSAFDTMREEILDYIRLYFAKKEQDVLAQLKYYFEQFRYAQHKCAKSAGLLSFNDVSHKNYELLTLNADRSFFYFRLDEKITHILLDEFQDTSLIQFQILSPIIDEICAGEGRVEIGERSLFIVGDEKQSIYMFRGSFPGIFDEATKTKAIAHEQLYDNWRSLPRIIDFNNRTFEPFFTHYIYQQYPKLKPKKDGYVRVLNVETDDEDEALQAHVYKEITLLLERGANANDIAILVFKNDDATSIKDYINDNNPQIQVITEASALLFEKTEVKFLINALWYIHLSLKRDSKDYGDLSAHTHTKSMDIIESQMAESADSIKAPSSQNIDSIQSQAYLARILRFYEKAMAKLLGKGYADSHTIIERIKALKITHSTQLSEIILSLIETFDIAQNASLKFLELACEYTDIPSFLEAIQNIECNAPTQSNSGIKIMTIHKSKGLEFPYLIVCDRIGGTRNDTAPFIYKYAGVHISDIYYRIKNRERVDALYATALEAHNKRIEQESYNMLYVAFTRAREGLSIVRKINKAKNEDKKKKERRQKNESAFENLSLESHYDDIPLLDSISQMQPKHTPIYVLTQNEFFGRQDAFLRHEKAEEQAVFNATQWRNICFGDALHNAFELKLNFRASDDDIAHILYNRYGYALSKENIAQAIKQALDCIANPLFSALLKDKNILCEVSYITDECLYRIDTCLYDKDEYIILDYKSGADNHNSHKEQVKQYMQFISTRANAKKVRGFIIYPLKNPNEQLCEVLSI